MKKYLLAFFAIAATLTLASCNDFLDDDPLDRVDSNDAFANEKELYLNAVAALYTHVGGNASSEGLQGTDRGVYDLNTFTTDEAIIPTRGTDWYDGGFWVALFTHQWATGNGGTGDAWNYLYKAIINCNKSLEHIDAFAQSHPTVDVTPYRTEVRALRALFLFYAMDLYGRIPIFDAAVPTSQQMKLKSRSEAFNFIRNELLDVTPKLSAERSNWPGEYYGRITRGVTLFVLAKLAINAEVYCCDNWTTQAFPSGKNILWNIDGKTLNTWEAAVFFCDAIADLGYTLEPSYATNFIVNNEISQENIFTIPMDRERYTNVFVNVYRSRHYNHAAALGLNGENGSCATREALIANGYGTPDQDPRFDLNYYHGTVYDNNGHIVLLDDGTPLVYSPWDVDLDLSGTPHEKTAGARMKKYAIDPNANKDGQQSNNDIVLFRYADVMLMKAEALLRNNAHDPQALAIVNTVRERVGAAPRATLTLHDILDERMIELAWEGWRRNDMIRFGTFNKPYSHHYGAAETDNHTIVFPLPGSHLGLTGDPQNPGY